MSWPEMAGAYRQAEIQDILPEDYEAYEALSPEEKTIMDDRLKLVTSEQEYTHLVQGRTSPEHYTASRIAVIANAVKAASNDECDLASMFSQPSDPVPQPLDPRLREGFATQFQSQAQFTAYVEAYFKSTTIQILPPVFEISKDGLEMTDLCVPSVCMILLKGLHYIYLSGQAKERELMQEAIGRYGQISGVTLASALEKVTEVMELEVKEIWRQSPLQPQFEDIKNYFKINVNLDNMNGIDENGDAVNGFSNLNACIMDNMKTVLEKLAAIVKNIKLSMAVDGEALATASQRAIFQSGFNPPTMSMYHFAIMCRVCGQKPDEDICGDVLDPCISLPTLTLILLEKVVDVYTPLLVQDINAMKKLYKKRASALKNRQAMKELRLEQQAAEKVAKEEKEAAVSAAKWEKEQAVKVALEQEQAELAAENIRKGQQGAADRIRDLAAPPPIPDTPDAIDLRKQQSADKKAAEKEKKTRKYEEKMAAGPNKKPKIKSRPRDT